MQLLQELKRISKLKRQKISKYDKIVLLGKAELDTIKVQFSKDLSG